MFTLPYVAFKAEVTLQRLPRDKSLLRSCRRHRSVTNRQQVVRREHNRITEAFTYGTRCRGIAQFYLHTQPFISE